MKHKDKNRYEEELFKYNNKKSNKLDGSNYLNHILKSDIMIFLVIKIKTQMIFTIKLF